MPVLYHCEASHICDACFTDHIHPYLLNTSHTHHMSVRIPLGHVTYTPHTHLLYMSRTRHMIYETWGASIADTRYRLRKI